MPVKLYFSDKKEDGHSQMVSDELLLTFVGELKRDADRKRFPAYVAILFSAKDLEVGNLIDLPRLLRQKATRMQEKINQLTAGSTQETVAGGIITEE